MPNRVLQGGGSLSWRTTLTSPALVDLPTACWSQTCQEASGTLLGTLLGWTFIFKGTTLSDATNRWHWTLALDVGIGRGQHSTLDLKEGIYPPDRTADESMNEPRETTCR